MTQPPLPYDSSAHRGPPRRGRAVERSRRRRRGGSTALRWIALATIIAGCGERRSFPTVTTKEPTAALRPAVVRGSIPHEARLTDYRIDARLDADTHQIVGVATVTWRNATARSVRSLVFHQYMNAFRADDTTWLRDGGDRHRGNKRDADAWGYLDIEAVHAGAPSQAGHAVESNALERPRLSWREHDEATLMTVTLDRDVRPGESVTVSIDFVTQLPRVFARTGYADEFHLVAQWYPKLAVFDQAQGWRAHPFTYHSEFFADFGHYDVRLDVPERFIVGATGIRIAESSADDRRVLEYRAEMVHDFAWAASPSFLESSVDVDGVRVRLLSSHDDPEVAIEHLETQRHALTSYQARYGPYPWTTITIVEPPSEAAGAGGMEYPTFFTTSAPSRARVLPTWLIDERVTASFTTLHEFGHQYFQGLLANDEYRFPWLDEGINSMSNVIALHDRYGDDAWVARLLTHELTMSHFLSLGMHDNAPALPIASGANEFSPADSGYHRVVYEKTAAVLLTLRNLVGPTRFDAAVRRYAITHRFAHPTPADFEAALLAELGPRPRLAREPDVTLDLPGFLDVTLRRPDAIDFAVTQVVHHRRRVGAGWHRDLDGTLVLTPAPTSNDANTPLERLDATDVESRASLTRSHPWPIELDVTFDDGSHERSWWTGSDTVTELEFPGRRVARVQLDPAHDYLIDAHRHDNRGVAREVDTPPTVAHHLANWVELLALAIQHGVGP